MKKITITISDEQYQYLERIIHEDVAENFSEAVIWALDSCFRIEKYYEVDACYVSFHDITKEGHPEFESEQQTAIEVAERIISGDISIVDYLALQVNRKRNLDLFKEKGIKVLIEGAQKLFDFGEDVLKEYNSLIKKS